MQKKILKTCICGITAAILVLVAGYSTAANQKSDSFFDIEVKFHDLVRLLDQIDQIAASDPAAPAPSVYIQSMLMGTNWIDPDRNWVIGINPNGPQAEKAVLIPFTSPNSNFQSAYNAHAGPDYYIVSIPPSTPDVSISDAARSALVAASITAPDMTVDVRLAVGRLLKNAEGPIRAGLAKLEATPAAEPGKTVDTPISPEDASRMVSNLLEVLGQLEQIRLGINVDSEYLSSRFTMDAKPDTCLAGLFAREKKVKNLLQSYRPEGAVMYRTLPYNIQEFMRLWGDTVGPVYQKIGIDFSKLTDMCDYMTGETAGGMDFDSTKNRMETICVLKDSDPSQEFLLKVLVPWIEDYSRQMTEMINTHSPKKMPDLLVRTADSTIAGRRVVGVSMKFPVMPVDVADASDLRPFAFDMRMTTVNNLLLAASDDERLRELIEISKAFSEKETADPLMTMTYDMGAYLRAVMSMFPKADASLPSVPDMGNVTFRGNVAAGSAEMASSMRLDDIKALIGYVRALSRAAKKTTAVKPAGSKAESKDNTRAAVRQSAAESPKPPVKDATYWYEKAALLETYGNHEAAIRCLNKSIELDSDQSEAYFLRGVAMGEIGEFDPAIASIDRALEMRPDNGRYHYARGRVCLLSGDETTALKHFQTAATLGDADAKAYLNRY